MKQWMAFVFFFAVLTVFSIGLAEAQGTLTVTFIYQDASGVAQPLSSAYVYLHDGSKSPPLEKYFTPADYILGPSDNSGRITASVPEGTYYVRITRRNSGIGPLGPPEAGDYTWMQANYTVTINTNTTTDLGTKYAYFFGSAPVNISGTVKTIEGASLAGRFVRVQTEPCILAYGGPVDQHPSNFCGPVKFLALQRTDANGQYTVRLRDAGTYYIYESQCLGDHHQDYIGNLQCVGTGTGPVTVQPGNTTVNIIVPYPYY